MATKTTPPVESSTTVGPRLDVQLHDLLQRPGTLRPAAPQPLDPIALPEPLFPRRPELLVDGPLPADAHGAPGDPYARRWTSSQVLGAMRGWLFPYVKSRVLPGDFHPIIAYLFTEWKCNLDCHYCWAFDNRVKGMT